MIWISGQELKLRYREKATKFEKNLPSILEITYFRQNDVGEFFQISVAFSEYFNFIFKISDKSWQHFWQKNASEIKLIKLVIKHVLLINFNFES